MKKFSLFIIIILLFIIGYSAGRDQVINQSTKVVDHTPPINQHQTGPYSVPILMYHYIRNYQNSDDPVGVDLSVSPATFEKQIVTLKNAGYQSISLTDLINRKIYTKSVVITFDDGYEDAYQAAYPILRRYGLSGTFFIIGNNVGKPGYLSKNQIIEMQNNGMEIGGHTMSHPNLTNTSKERAAKEISNSILGYSPVFAYPAGKYNAEVVATLEALDVKAAVTTNEGLATESCHPLTLPRVRIREKTDIMKSIIDLMALKAVCQSELLTPTAVPSPTILPTSLPTALPTIQFAPSPSPTSSITPDSDSTPTPNIDQ